MDEDEGKYEEEGDCEDVLIHPSGRGKGRRRRIGGRPIKGWR